MSTTAPHRWRKAALDTIVALHPNAVVASSSTSCLIAFDPVTPAQWATGLRTTLGRLDAARIPTFLQSCHVVRAHAFAPAAFTLAQNVAARLSHVSTIDLSDEICGPEICPPLRNGVVVFRDVNHLTASYVRTLAPGRAPAGWCPP